MFPPGLLSLPYRHLGTELDKAGNCPLSFSWRPLQKYSCVCECVCVCWRKQWYMTLWVSVKAHTVQW